MRQVWQNFDKHRIRLTISQNVNLSFKRPPVTVERDMKIGA